MPKHKFNFRKSNSHRSKSNLRIRDLCRINPYQSEHYNNIHQSIVGFEYELAIAQRYIESSKSSELKISVLRKIQEWMDLRQHHIHQLKLVMNLETELHMIKTENKILQRIIEIGKDLETN